MTQTPPSDPDPLPSDAGPRTSPEADLGQPGNDSGKDPGKDPLRSSLTGRAWVSVVALGVVLVLLIVFIAQNTRSVTVTFLGWQGHTPLAVALLIATVAGLFLAAVAGTLRIWQLRRRVRRESRRESRRSARA